MLVDASDAASPYEAHGPASLAGVVQELQSTVCFFDHLPSAGAIKTSFALLYTYSFVF